MKIMTTAFAPFDAATYLDSDEVIADYLSAAAEDPDLDVFLAALGDVAKARGMAQIARDAWLGRESLLEALSEARRPALRDDQRDIARARSKVRDRPTKRGHCAGAVTAAAGRIAGMSIPFALRKLLGDHEVMHTSEEGWDGLSNGELIAAAGAPAMRRCSRRRASFRDRASRESRIMLAR